jgi:hypothetical protein
LERKRKKKIDESGIEIKKRRKINWIPKLQDPQEGNSIISSTTINARSCILTENFAFYFISQFPPPLTNRQNPLILACSPLTCATE